MIRDLLKKEPTDMPSETKLSDLYFAAYLVANGFQVLRTEPQPDSKRGKLDFIVSIPGTEFQKLRSAWVSRTGTVVASVYAEELKRLKMLCHL